MKRTITVLPEKKKYPFFFVFFSTKHIGSWECKYTRVSRTVIETRFSPAVSRGMLVVSSFIVSIYLYTYICNGDMFTCTNVHVRINYILSRISDTASRQYSLLCPYSENTCLAVARHSRRRISGGSFSARKYRSPNLRVDGGKKNRKKEKNLTLREKSWRKDRACGF